MKKCCNTCIHKKVCDYWEKEARPEEYGTYDGEPCMDYLSVDTVYGEWIPIVNYFWGKPDGRYYCSQCRRVVNKRDNFCRNCGAHMNGGKSNG